MKKIYKFSRFYILAIFSFLLISSSFELLIDMQINDLIYGSEFFDYSTEQSSDTSEEESKLEKESYEIIGRNLLAQFFDTDILSLCKHRHTIYLDIISEIISPPPDLIY